MNNFFNGCQSCTPKTVTVQNAYDETVETGKYVCSCGATK